MSSLKDVAPVKPKLPPLINVPTLDQLVTTYSASSHQIAQPSSSSQSLSSNHVLTQTITAGSSGPIPASAPPARLYKTAKRRIARPAILRKRTLSPKIERQPSPESSAEETSFELNVDADESATASEADAELSQPSLSDDPKPLPSAKKKKFPPSLDEGEFQQEMTLQELANVISATSKLISDANVSTSKPASSEVPLSKSRSPFRFPSVSKTDALPPPKAMISSADIPSSSQRKLTPVADQMSSLQISNSLLPADTRKELFVSIPSSSKTLPISVPILPSSRRNSKALEASFAFDNDPSSPQSVGSPVYSPSDLPPRQPDFDYTSFQEGDVILVDRSELGDGLRKATIIYVNKEYSSSSQYFQGELIVLKPAAQKSMILVCFLLSLIAFI